MGIMVLSQRSRFYPDFGIANMQARQGSRWSELVAWVARLPGSDPHVMALTRMLRQIARRVGSQASPHRDPFCALCADETLAAFNGSEDDLLRMYHRNLREINDTLTNMRLRDRTARPDAAIA